MCCLSGHVLTCTHSRPGQGCGCQYLTYAHLQAGQLGQLAGCRAEVLKGVHTPAVMGAFFRRWPQPEHLPHPSWVIMSTGDFNIATSRLHTCRSGQVDAWASSWPHKYCRSALDRPASSQAHKTHSDGATSGCSCRQHLCRAGPAAAEHSSPAQRHTDGRGRLHCTEAVSDQVQAGVKPQQSVRGMPS